MLYKREVLLTNQMGYRAGSPKNCVSHATPYSRYVSSRKRLIIFAYFFLLFCDEDCIECLVIRSLNFSGIYNPERKKSINPILTWIHQKYAIGTVCSVYQKKTRNFTIIFSYLSEKQHSGNKGVYTCFESTR